MVDRYMSPKFGVNLLDGVRENDVYGWRTTDGRTTEIRSWQQLYCAAAQRRVKNVSASNYAS